MVTVRQFSRGVGRTMRAMEREAARQQRQRLLNEKAFARQSALDASYDAASAYSRLVDLLIGSHRVPFGRRDWAELANASPPEEPSYRNTHEQTATAALAAYRPNWFAKLLGSDEKHRSRLATAISEARTKDANVHREACQKADERRDQIVFAQGVLAGQSKALLAAVDEHSNLDETAVEGVNILAIDGRVIAVVDGFEVEDMPTQSITLLQSGKSSTKQLPAGKILEMHRDNICSSAIRVATEFLGVLPVDSVEVVMQTDLLDRATGHIRSEHVLYVRVTAQALQSVNLTQADPAMLAERLGAHFNWNRKDGFRPINLGAFDLPLELLADGTEIA